MLRRLPLVLLAACSWEAPELWGDDRRVQLASDLDRSAEIWEPSRAVATGSIFHLTAVRWIDSSGVEHEYGPNDSVTSDDPAVLEVRSVSDDEATLSALADGEATLAWSGGDADDTLTIAVATAASVALTDPAVAGFQLLAVAFDATILDGAPPPLDLDLVLPVVRDSTFDAWIDLRGADGRSVAFVDLDVDASGTGALALGDHLSLAADAASTVDLTFGGAPLAPTFAIERVPVETITTVELVVTDVGNLRDHFAADLAVMLVARDADGRRVLQPPVSWVVPEGFDIVASDDLLANLDYGPRPDVMFLDWVQPGGTSVQVVTLTASVGALVASNTVTATLVGPDAEEDDDPGDAPVLGQPDPCCLSCGSGGSALMFVVLAPFVGSRRRGRRPA